MQRRPALQITSTASLAGPDRFSYWADVVTQTFVPLQCDTPDRNTFFGDVRHRQVGLVGVTEVRASALSVTRTSATIAKAPRDDLIVVLQLDGSCHTGQGRSQATLLSGEGAVVATDECYFFEFPEGFRQLVLKLPIRLVAEGRIGGTGERSLLLSKGPATLLQRLALSLLEDAVDVSTEEEAGIEYAFADLLRSATRPFDAAENQLETSEQFAAACQFIRRELANPALKPAVVAAHVGMSTRNLARLFAKRGTSIERMFWAERLKAARRDLADPLSHDRSVTDIAFSWGFNDAAHFSRSFSKMYGQAPSTYRATHFRRPRREN